MNYKIIMGNIVSLDESVQAIVNSANPYMSRGGGVCGAIHKVAGFAFTEFCVKQGGLKQTECKITPGFELPYEYVIHSLAPIYNKTEKPEEDLINTYLNVIRLAKKLDIISIAFPILGCGHYKYPIDLGIKCALSAFKMEESESLKCILVCFTQKEYQIAKEVEVWRCKNIILKKIRRFLTYIK